MCFKYLLISLKNYNSSIDKQLNKYAENLLFLKPVNANKDFL